MKYKSFIKALEAGMKANNTGIRELARRCDLDASFISKILQGKRSPPSDEKVIIKIAEVLSLDPLLLVIYTGRIPSVLQQALESPSFVKNIISGNIAVPPALEAASDAPSLSGSPAFKDKPGHSSVDKFDIGEELL
jgi:transcriptional regulator with XRE-family HTH domain